MTATPTNPTSTPIAMNHSVQHTPGQHRRTMADMNCSPSQGNEPHQNIRQPQHNAQQQQQPSYKQQHQTRLLHAHRTGQQPREVQQQQKQQQQQQEFDQHQRHAYISYLQQNGQLHDPQQQEQQLYAFQQLQAHATQRQAQAQWTAQQNSPAMNRDPLNIGFERNSSSFNNQSSAQVALHGQNVSHVPPQMPQRKQHESAPIDQDFFGLDFSTDAWPTTTRHNIQACYTPQDAPLQLQQPMPHPTPSVDQDIHNFDFDINSWSGIVQTSPQASSFSRGPQGASPHAQSLLLLEDDPIIQAALDTAFSTPDSDFTGQLDPHLTPEIITDATPQRAMMQSPRRTGGDTSLYLSGQNSTHANGSGQGFLMPHQAHKQPGQFSGVHTSHNGPNFGKDSVINPILRQAADLFRTDPVQNPRVPNLAQTQSGASQANKPPRAKKGLPNPPRTTQPTAGTYTRQNGTAVAPISVANTPSPEMHHIIPPRYQKVNGHVHAMQPVQPPSLNGTRFMTEPVRVNELVPPPHGTYVSPYKAHVADMNPKLKITESIRSGSPSPYLGMPPPVRSKTTTPLSDAKAVSRQSNFQGLSPVSPTPQASIRDKSPNGGFPRGAAEVTKSLPSSQPVTPSSKMVANMKAWFHAQDGPEKQSSGTVATPHDAGVGLRGGSPPCTGSGSGPTPLNRPGRINTSKTAPRTNMNTSLVRKTVSIAPALSITAPAPAQSDSPNASGKRKLEGDDENDTSTMQQQQKQQQQQQQHVTANVASNEANPISSGSKKRKVSDEHATSRHAPAPRQWTSQPEERRTQNQYFAPRTPLPSDHYVNGGGLATLRVPYDTLAEDEDEQIRIWSRMPISFEIYKDQVRERRTGMARRSVSDVRFQVLGYRD